MIISTVISFIFKRLIAVSGLVLNEVVTLGFHRNVAAGAGECWIWLKYCEEWKKVSYKVYSYKKTDIYGRSMHIFCIRCTITTKYLMCFIKLSCYQCAEISLIEYRPISVMFLFIYPMIVSYELEKPYASIIQIRSRVRICDQSFYGLSEPFSAESLTGNYSHTG